MPLAASPRSLQSTAIAALALLGLAAAPLAAGELQHQYVVSVPSVAPQVGGPLVTLMVCVYYDEDPETGVDTDGGVMVYIAFFGPEEQEGGLGVSALPEPGWGSWHAGSQANCPNDPPVLAALADVPVPNLDGPLPP